MIPGDELRVEELLGRTVAAPDGTVAGRIQEMRAIREGNYFVVAEFHIGTGALLERLAVRPFGGLRRRLRGYRVRWDQIDLSDPVRPRLLCDVAELRKIA